MIGKLGPPRSLLFIVLDIANVRLGKGAPNMALRALPRARLRGVGCQGRTEWAQVPL